MLANAAAASGVAAAAEIGLLIAHARGLLHLRRISDGRRLAAHPAVEGSSRGTIDRYGRIGSVRRRIAAVRGAYGIAIQVLPCIAVPVAVGGQQREMALAGGDHRIVR